MVAHETTRRRIGRWRTLAVVLVALVSSLAVGTGDAGAHDCRVTCLEYRTLIRVNPNLQSCSYYQYKLTTHRHGVNGVVQYFGRNTGWITYGWSGRGCPSQY